MKYRVEHKIPIHYQDIIPEDVIFKRIAVELIESLPTEELQHLFKIVKVDPFEGQALKKYRKEEFGRIGKRELEGLKEDCVILFKARFDSTEEYISDNKILNLDKNLDFYKDYLQKIAEPEDGTKFKKGETPNKVFITLLKMLKELVKERETPLPREELFSNTSLEGGFSPISGESCPRCKSDKQVVYPMMVGFNAANRQCKRCGCLWTVCPSVNLDVKGT